MSKHIRTTVKAIIYRDGKILLIEKEDAAGVYYGFPGGGQEHGEILPAALERECLEEVNARVSVGDMLFIREYIGKNHEFAQISSDRHQVDFYFLCTVSSDYKPKPGSHPDHGQLDIVWASTNDLRNLELYPKTLLPFLTNLDKLIASKAYPLYLGDVN